MTHTSSCFLPPFLTEKAPRHSATLRVGSPEPPGGLRREGHADRAPTAAARAGPGSPGFPSSPRSLRASAFAACSCRSLFSCVGARHRARDPRPQAPAHLRLPCPDPEGPLATASAAAAAHLQRAEEEVPEGLHGAERVLQGQLLGVLAQVVGQLQLLLLDGLEHLLQRLGRLDAGLGVTARWSRPGEGAWALWPQDRGTPLARGAPARASAPALASRTPAWQTPGRGGGVGVGCARADTAPWGAPATLACRR